MNNFFDKLTGGGGGGSSGNNNKKKNPNPFANVDNPFANIGKSKKQNFGGGQSLGGSSTLGKVTRVTLCDPGPLGMKIEKRPNNEGSAIVSTVVENSQAHAAGLQRGDVLCHAGTDGQHEIMYNEFIAMASSEHRPLEFDIRRIQTKAAAGGGSAGSRSAEAYARKQAVIAAAEKRERAHKQKSKPVAKVGVGGGTLPALLSTADKLRLDKEREERAKASAVPMSDEAKKAVEQAKRGEEVHAATLGYNPYETARATAGQARTANVAMTHGSIQDKEGSGSSQQQPMAAPNRVAPPPSLPEASSQTPQVSQVFEDAMTTVITTNDHEAVKSSLGIMRKLIVNATTKGQANGDEAASAKFRRVRLSNKKIKAAIPDMNGALELMFSTGFQLAEEEGETYLVYPPGNSGPEWLPNAVKTMQDYETSP